MTINCASITQMDIYIYVVLGVQLFKIGKENGLYCLVTNHETALLLLYIMVKRSTLCEEKH